VSWAPRRLDQLGYVSRGRSRHRPRDAAHLYDGPYPFIQTGDVKHAGLYITEYQQTYSEAGLEQSRLWPAGTLCITIAANIADTAILDFDACFPDSVIGFISEPGKSNAKFVKYLFDATVQRRVQQFTQGAAQDNLSQEKLLSIEFMVPEADEQKRISDVLSAYDELIKNNQRRMALLEESARQLYREWFVRLRFPGHEHTNITNGVPQGWEHVPTPEAIEVNPTTRLSGEDDHWYVEMSDLLADSMLIQQATKRDGRSGSKFRNGDTLLARITPCLENGKTAFVDFMADDDVGRGSTEFIVLRSKRLTPEFVYCLARTYDFRENAIKSMVGSSGRQRVQESCFGKFFVCVPPQTLLSLFTESARPIFRQIRGLHAQNQKLKAARDLLLPRLINGEIAV
jgi:type I restriction enzyme S subunit